MRFVILAQPRTGSSLLVSSLRQHPQVMCRDEVLNAWQAKWFQDCPSDGRGRLLHCLSAPGEKAVGCKLHVSQPDADHHSPLEWESAWDALSEDPEIRVICLYRQDLIAQLASFKIAAKTNQWGVQNIVQRPTIEILPDELKWFQKWNRMAYQARLGRLTHHCVLSVSYEQLTSAWDTTLEFIQQFLEVNVVSLRQSISKGETRMLEDVVQNYRQLIALPWARESVISIPVPDHTSSPAPRSK